MNKEQLDYINGLTNVMPCDGMTIGREKQGKMEYVVISLDGKEFLTFWHNPYKKNSKDKKTPKHTGGKPSYVKLMLAEVRKYKSLSIEAHGFFIKIADNIQWNTNLLIDIRSKKALIPNDMADILKVGRTKTYEIIKELKTAKLLIKDKDGYKLSTTLIQKGGEKIENNKI